MSGERFEDLAGVEVEHMLGAATGLPLVKVRAAGERTILLGQLSPAQAREIACHLFEAAARAEYEADLDAGLRSAAGPDPDPAAHDQLLGFVLHAVRNGEHRRHTS